MKPITEYMLRSNKVSSIDEYMKQASNFRFPRAVNEYMLQSSKVSFPHVVNEYLSTKVVNHVKDMPYVDLGLPSGALWAECNVGATCESDPESWYGDYFMWGETTPAKEYDWSNYKYCNGAYNKLTKYCNKNKNDYWGGIGTPDNKLKLELEDDAANANLGAEWYMPSKEQFKELLSHTTNSWVTDYDKIKGLNGILFTSKTNDNTLFFPAAGLCSSSYVNNIGSNVYVWSSSLFSGDPSSAIYFYANYAYADLSLSTRYYGCPVRGVLN